MPFQTPTSATASITSAGGSAVNADGAAASEPPLPPLPPPRSHLFNADTPQTPLSNLSRHFFACGTPLHGTSKLITDCYDNDDADSCLAATTAIVDNTQFAEGMNASFATGVSYKDAVRLDAEHNNGKPSFAASLPMSLSLCASAVDADWAKQCQNAQPFGVHLGTGLGLVPAYSNGAVEDISHGESYLPGTEIYCGMPWECLEYARRFLIAYYGITFASMDGANSLFDCDYFQYLENSEKHQSDWSAPMVTVKREVNGEATKVPPVGALLLYPIVYPAADMPFGHVAVVVERSQHHIRVAEQNWDNSKWAHSRYSRQIEVSVDESTGKITVTDEDPYTVLGWLDFTMNEPRPPRWERELALSDPQECGRRGVVVTDGNAGEEECGGGCHGVGTPATGETPPLSSTHEET